MHDSRQYSINPEEASRLQLKLAINQFTQELCRFGYCEKITEQATWNENVSENDLNLKLFPSYFCEILLTVGKNHDRHPWPETRIFIAIDSACRNQHGNCDEVEIVPGHFFQHCG